MDTVPIRLNLFHGGEFVQHPDGSFEYSGGALRCETIPPSARYADLCWLVSEALGAAVGLKYRCPGEDLDPGALITLADDDDVEELREEFMAAADRFGRGNTSGADESTTEDSVVGGGSNGAVSGPAVDVFAFPAAEDPLTPQEIMNAVAHGRGSDAMLGVARLASDAVVSAYGPLYDPAMCDPDAFALEQQALLHALAADAAAFGGAAGSGSSGVMVAGSASGATSEFDADVLVAIAGGGSSAITAGYAAGNGVLPWSAAVCGDGVGVGVCDEAYLLSECLPSDSTPYGCGDDDGEEGCGSPMYEAADEAEAEMAAYWTLHEAAAEAAAKRASLAAAAEAAATGVVATQEEDPLPVRQGLPPLARLMLPADPFEQEASSPSSGTAVLEAANDLAVAGDTSPTRFAAANEATPLHERLAAPFGAEPLGDPTVCLPSHISAFGSADGSDAGDVDIAHTHGDGIDLNIDLNAIVEEAEAGTAALAAAVKHAPKPRRRSRSCSPADGVDRQGSGDSVTSLPRVQPVHRLLRADIRVVSKVGEGAFGEVSLAQAPLYGTVAVKWLKSELFSKHSTSFLREAALLSDLHHPNVLRFYGVVVDAPTTAPTRPSSSSATTAAASPSPSPRAVAAAAGTTPTTTAFGGERVPSPAPSSSAPPTPAAARVVGIVTEFVPGGPLSRFLRASRAPLPLRLRCELALQAANGLAYLHELSTVHFDLKPDNLLLDGPPALVAAAARAGETPASPAGSGAPSPASAGDAASAAAAAPAAALARAVAAGWAPTVKVADFGLAKHKLGGNYVSSCRDLRGTLPYMAPELVADPEHVSEKADCWSLGVVMWEMLTREAPYKDLTAHAVLRGLMTGALTLDVPEWAEPEWRGLLEACLEPNPDNRPSMRELARQIEAIRDQAAAEADAAEVAIAAVAAAGAVGGL